MSDVKPMRLSRFATLWNVEGEVEAVPNASTLVRYIYEPLETHAPEEAEAYCCYLKTVIFYERMAGEIKEMTRCDHYDLACAPSPHLLYDAGTWYEASGDRVVWRNGQWHFRFRLDARTQVARILNLGLAAARSEFQR